MGAALVGRARELGRLERLVDGVEAGRGAAALVRGEPGVGKSSLAAALVERVAARATVLWGACLDHAAAPAFGPWRLALESPAAAARIADAAAALGAASAVLAPLVPSLRARGDLLPPVPLDAAEARLRLHEAVAALLRELARERPLLVVLDDLHWIDPDSLELLRYLLLALPRERWLLVGTTREAGSAQAAALAEAFGRTPDHEHVELTGLDRAQAAEMMSAVLGREAPPDVVAVVHAETHGVPFYVRELSLAFEEGRAGAVPRSVHDALAARLLRLAPAAREVLVAVAVLSRPADAALLAAITGSALEPVLGALEEASRAGLVRAGEGGGHEPTHALFRRALLESMLPERLALLRRRVAAALASRGGDAAADEVATQIHLSRGLPGAEAGVRPAVLAAEGAEQGAAHDRAARFWRIASELAPAGGGERAEVLRRLAIAEAATLRFDEAAAAARGALAAGAAAHEMHAVVRAMKQGGAPAASWEPLVAECLARIGSRDVRWARLAVAVERIEPVARGPWCASEWLPPDADAVSALRASGQDGDLAATVSPFAARGRGETAALEARAAAMQPGSDRVAVLDAVIRDWIHRHSDYRRALAAAGALLAESVRTGHLAGEAEAHYALAKCHAILGDLAQARRSADRVPPLVARLGDAHRLRFTVRTALTFEIDYFGGGERWRDIAGEAVRFARDPRCGETPLGALAMAFGALASALAGERATAAEIAAALPPIVGAMRPHAYQRKGAIDLGAAAVWHLGLREHAEAYRALLAAAPADEGAAPITCSDLGLARMAALAGDRRETQRRYERARAWAEERGARPLAAVALLEQGLAGGARRGMTAARAHVEEALAAFVALGMTPWIAEAQRAGGGARVLPDGLTVREAEVLALVAEGLANKELAARLRISPATVQRHLANAYAKIGATSRTQATSYVLRAGLSYMAGPTRSA